MKKMTAEESGASELVNPPYPSLPDAGSDTKWYGKKYHPWAQQLTGNENAEGINLNFDTHKKDATIYPAVCKEPFYETFSLSQIAKLQHFLTENKSSFKIHNAIGSLEVKNCVETFHSLGIQVYLVNDYCSILQSEEVRSPLHLNEELFELSKPEKDMKHFFMLIHQYHGHHLFASMTNTINRSRAKEYVRDEEEINDLIDQMSKKYSADSVQWSLFGHILTTAQVGRETFLNEAITYSETQITEFYKLYLRACKFHVTSPRIIKLPFGTQSEDQVGLMVIPNMFFCDIHDQPRYAETTNKEIPVECKSPSFSTTPKKDKSWLKAKPSTLSQQFKNPRSLREKQKSIRSTLVWQVFEQLLGIMLEKYNDNMDQNGYKTFQTGFIIENDKVTICMLVVDYDVFEELVNISQKDITNTTQVEKSFNLLMRLATARKDFGRLYIGERKEDFWYLPSFGRACNKHLCKIYTKDEHQPTTTQLALY